jgi:hypothetical protein
VGLGCPLLPLQRQEDRELPAELAHPLPRSHRRLHGCPPCQPKVVGSAGYIVSDRPAAPSSSFIDRYAPINQRYLQAVQTAQFLANTTGRAAFVCSSLGANCKTDGGKVIPVVYVQPGGIVKRYKSELPLTASAAGSQVGITNVNEEVFRELIRESAGQSRLGWGA